MIEDALEALHALWLILCQWFWAIIDELIRDYGA